MYFKECYGFAGTPEQIQKQKNNLKDMLIKLGCKVVIEDKPELSEGAFILTVERDN